MGGWKNLKIESGTGGWKELTIESGTGGWKELEWESGVIYSQDFEGSGIPTGWVDNVGSPDYDDTAQHHTGSKSLKLPSEASCSYDGHTFQNTGENTLVWVYLPTTTTSTYVQVGHGSYAVYAQLNRSNNHLWYHDVAWQEVNYNIPAASWFELKYVNLNFTAHTYDIWINGAVRETGAGMFNTANYNDKFWLESNAYFDDLEIY